MMRLAISWALGIVFTCAGQASMAQLPPCAGVTEPGLKVLLDDIYGADAMALAALSVQLESALRKWSLESRDMYGGGPGAPELVRIRALRCERRQPSGRASFTAPMVRELNSAQVVLEVWAQTQAQAAGKLRAIVGYALVPVRHYEPDSEYGVIMMEREIPHAKTPEQLLELLEQSGQMAVYAELSSGLRLLNAEDFSKARTQLCSAIARLQRGGEGKTAGEKADRESLKLYLQTLSVETVKRAQAKGQLRGIDPTPCEAPPL